MTKEWSYMLVFRGIQKGEHINSFPLFNFQRPERISSLLHHLMETGIIKKCSLHSDKLVTKDEVASTHSPMYIKDLNERVEKVVGGKEDCRHFNLFLRSVLFYSRYVCK